MKAYIAADHTGFGLKQELISFLQALGYDVEDCGAFVENGADDYPDFIGEAAKKLSADIILGKNDSRAIVIGASGQGEAMVANREKGVRCALYYGEAAVMQTDASGKVFDMIASTRAHNDANALSLAARFLTVHEAKAAVEKFIRTPISNEERHIRRIKKIDD